MKTCLVCGRNAQSNQTACAHCGSRLPESASTTPHEEAAHIAFLVEQLDEWVAAGWVNERQAHALSTEYTRRRAALLFDRADGASIPQPLPAFETHKPSPYDFDVAIPEPSAPLPAAKRSVSSLADSASLSYWHLVGVVLIVVGLATSFAITYRSGHKAAQVALLLIVTALFAALPSMKPFKGSSLTGSSFRAIAAMLVPLDIVAALARGFFGHHLSIPVIGGSAACGELVVAATLCIRYQARSFAVLAVASVVAVLYFGLQGSLPSLMQTHNPSVLLSAYGIVYALLAWALDILAARLARAHDIRAIVVRATSHAVMAASVIVALSTSGGGLGVNLPLTLLIGALLYTAASLRDDQPAFGLVGGVFGGACAFAAIEKCGFARWSDWYVFGGSAAILAWLYWGVETVASRREAGVASHAFRAASKTAAFVALGSIALDTVAVLLAFPSMSGVRALDLWGLFFIGAAVTIFAFVTRHIAAFAIRSGVTYLVVVLGLLGATYMPAISMWHAQPNMALTLAVAAAVWLWGFRQRRTAMVTAAVALAPCALYAVNGAFFDTSVAAFALVAVVIASAFVLSRQPAETRDDTVFETWLGLSAATALVILVESHLLPYCRIEFQVEPNYGYGLMLATLAALGLAFTTFRDSKESRRALIQYCYASTAVNVAIQLWCSLNGFRVSPWLLIDMAVAAAGFIALRTAHRNPALLTGALVAAGYVAFWMRRGFVPALHDYAIGAALTLAALLLARIAVVSPQKDGSTWRSAFLTAFAAAMHLVYAICPYGAVEAPLVTLLPCICLWIVSLSRIELRDSAKAVASAISGAASLTACIQFALSPHTHWQTPAALIGYAIVALTISAFEQNPAQLAMVATAWNAAVAGLLLRHNPGLTTGQIALGFSFAALPWLIPMALRRRISWAADSARTVASVVALAATITALFSFTKGGGGHVAIVAMLVCWTILTWIGLKTRRASWQSIGIATGILSICAFLGVRSLGPAYDIASLVFLPAGAFAIAISWKFPATRSRFDALASLGLVYVLLPGLSIVDLGRHIISAAVFTAILCIAGILGGLGARRRAFVAIPTAALALLLAAMARSSSGIAWPAFIVALGILVTISAALFSRKTPAS